MQTGNTFPYPFRHQFSTNSSIKMIHSKENTMEFFVTLRFYFFATLCPIPPWLRTIFCLSVFVKLRLPRLGQPAKLSAPSRNLGKGSGDSKTIEGERVPYPSCILCGKHVIRYAATSAHFCAGGVPLCCRNLGKGSGDSKTIEGERVLFCHPERRALARSRRIFPPVLAFGRPFDKLRVTKRFYPLEDASTSSA